MKSQKHPDKKILIFSTYSTDKVTKNGKTTITKGGPLFFIQNAFEDNGVPFLARHGETIDVEIKVEHGKEKGRVANFPKSIKISGPKDSPIVVLSTIFNEWDFSNLDKFKGKIFVDIQGYVRDPDKFGGKKVWNPSLNILKQIYCLKGNKEEMKYLSKNALKDQKKRLLIITNGKQGIEWYSKRKKYSIKNGRKIKVPDTIGAGDTFFGYFIASRYDGINVRRSICNAISKTSEFLESKTNE